MAIDTDFDKQHKKQQSQKLSKHQTEAKVKPDIPSTKWTKRRVVKSSLERAVAPEVVGPKVVTPEPTHPSRKLK